MKLSYICTLTGDGSKSMMRRRMGNVGSNDTHTPHTHNSSRRNVTAVITTTALTLGPGIGTVAVNIARSGNAQQLQQHTRKEGSGRGGRDCGGSGGGGGIDCGASGDRGSNDELKCRLWWQSQRQRGGGGGVGRDGVVVCESR